jgi:hypothetical protein
LQILRSFSIIAAVVLIIASSNISFKLGNNDASARINGEAPLIDNAFLSIDDQSIFSSLLQTINAQEQEEKIDQEENGKDSDAVMDKEEEQDEEEGGGDSEKESLIEQEQDGSEVQQKQDEIKVDCAQGEHFDSELNSCIPDKEKVCDDDRDNDNDGRVDSEDSDCLHNKNEQEQQNNGNEQENKEKLPAVEEQSLNKKEENKGEENPVSIVEQQQQQQQNNNDISSDSYEAEDRAQNSTQNLTDRHTIATTGTTITTNDNASLNEFHYPANASAAVQDNGYTLKCDPEGAEMLPGEEDSITCTIENKTPKPIELALVCSGLDGTGIECRINGEYPIGKTLVKEMSYTNFSVLLVSRSSPSVPAGSYPFSISSEECINSGLC